MLLLRNEAFGKHRGEIGILLPSPASIILLRITNPDNLRERYLKANHFRR